jgi:hypothetical protein
MSDRGVIAVEGFSPPIPERRSEPMPSVAGSVTGLVNGSTKLDPSHFRW